MNTLFVGKSLDKIRLAKKHQHDSWEIVIPVYGSGFVETNEQKVPFSVGTVYVMPPFMEHTTWSEECFSDIYIRTDSLDLNTQAVISVSCEQGLPELANLMHELYLKRHQGFRASLEATLALIVQLVRDHCHQSGEDTLPYRIRSYLIRNMDRQELDMQLLTEVFGYCSDHIRRVFKEAYGSTPMDFLQSFRITHAKKMLRNMPFCTVADISTQCGYADRFYFSRVFKAKTGYTPSQYRDLPES